MSQIISGLLWNICLFYLEDMIGYARTGADRLERLIIAFSRFRALCWAKDQALQVYFFQKPDTVPGL